MSNFNVNRKYITGCGDIDSLSLEETRKLLHNLRIYQIELEMQNEELCRIQAELNVSKAKYFELYDLAPVGYCTISENGLIIEANYTAAEFLGLKRDALVNANFTNFICYQDQDIFYMHCKKLFQICEPQNCEIRLNCGDKKKWVLIRSSIAKGCGEEKTCRMTISDINEYKKAEIVIIDSELKLKKIFASISDSIIITDLSGKILEVNEHACQKLKYEKHQLIGLTIADINAQFHRLEIDFRLKKIERYGKFLYESHYVASDGTVFPVEISASMTEFQKIPAIITLVRDISARVNVENAFIESEKRYHELIEMSSEGFWVIDNNGNTIYLNRQMANMIGYTAAEIEKKNVGEFIYQDNLNSYYDVYSKLTRGNARHYEALLKHKSGKKIYVKVSASALTDREGNAAGRLALVTDVTEKIELEQKIDLVKKESLKNYTLGDVVGKSEYMKFVFETLPSISECGGNVMIEGPSGTGKSLIARTIHNLSPRHGGPFVVINCGAIPETLLESELFGYVRGAFTDAKTDKPGKFAAADKGTIFLDEIGEVPMHLQVKLLRVIEEKSFEPLGSAKTVKVNFRLIAATNRNLKKLVEEGKFREDLFYRLRVIYFNIPPLRERREDIELLAYSFINRLNIKENKNINSLSDEVRTILLTYDFPGNARQLYNMLEYAYIICRDGKIKLSDLPEEYSAFYNKIIKEKVDSIVANYDETNCKGKSLFAETKCNQVETKCKKCEIGIETLLEYLVKYKYNKIKTSKALNISRVTLWRLMKKFNITD